MKVLVTGIGGQLGFALEKTTPSDIEIAGFDREAMDLASGESILDTLTKQQPDAVINAGAYTAVDRAESEPELAEKVNGEAVRVLADYCQAERIPLIQVSTDFVFDGKSGSPYAPDAPVEPLSVYGETKLAGERYALERCETAYVVRTSWVYCEHGANFVKTMLRLGAERDELGVVSDQVGTPTYAFTLAQAIWDLLQKRPRLRIFHITDAGVASWYDFAQAIFEEAVVRDMLQATPKLKPILTSDYPTPAKRPPYSVLAKEESWVALGIQPSHWRDALRQMLDKLQGR